MTLLVQAGSLLMTLLILVVFARNLFTRQYELLSWRNIYLVGFILFYTLALLFTAKSVVGGRVAMIQSRASVEQDTLVQLMFLMVMFLGLTLLAAHAGFKQRWLSSLLPKFDLNPSGPALSIIAIVGSLVAIVASLVPPEGFVGLLVTQFRGGLAAVAVACATYYVLSNRLNPVAWGVLVAALGAGAIAAMLGGNGRRALIGIFAAAGWMWYFSALRFQRPNLVMGKVVIAAIPVFLVLFAYSSVRRYDINEGLMGGYGLQKRVESLKAIGRQDEVVSRGFEQVLYQDTAFNTGFILQAYPGTYDYRQFDDFVWYFVNPIPRSVWPGKPVAFGEVLMDQMEVQANLGPGIIGHGWAAFGVIGVGVYAVFFGTLIGVFDRAIADRAFSPFFLAWVSADLGNLLGMTRGDVALFALQITAAMVAAGGLIYGVKVFLGPVVGAFPTLMPPAWRRIAELQEAEERDESAEPPVEVSRPTLA